MLENRETTYSSSVSKTHGPIYATLHDQSADKYLHPVFAASGCQMSWEQESHMQLALL